MSNFRTAYYKKIGMPSVELSKKFQEILSAHVVDIKELSRLCVRFNIPKEHRTTVWLHLLEIVPIVKDARDFVRDQKEQQYFDLLEAAEIIDSLTASQHLSAVEKVLLRSSKQDAVKSLTINSERESTIISTHLQTQSPSNDSTIITPNLDGGTGLGLVNTTSTTPLTTSTVEKPTIELCTIHVAKLFIRMHLIDHPQLLRLRITREDIELLLMDICMMLRDLATSCLEWYLLFSQFSKKTLGSPYICRHEFAKILKILQSENPRCQAHIKMLKYEHQERLFEAWVLKCYLDTFPKSRIGVVWDRVIASPQSVAIYLGLAITLVLAPDMLKVQSAEELCNFLCSPPSRLIEAQIDRILDFSYTLMKRYELPACDGRHHHHHHHH
eukprot:m.173782 g.173782  ORF g.173782 m.173782 type:complete len:384 (-) comp15394_c2_seq1:2015-3166(-)